LGSLASVDQLVAGVPVFLCGVVGSGVTPWKNPTPGREVSSRAVGTAEAWTPQNHLVLDEKELQVSESGLDVGPFSGPFFLPARPNENGAVIPDSEGLYVAPEILILPSAF